MRPRGPDKLIWLVNLALLFTMTLCVASGILISRVALPELRISLPLDDPFWDRAHAHRGGDAGPRSCPRGAALAPDRRRRPQETTPD